MSTLANEKPARAIVAAVQLPRVSDAELEASLSELRQLAKTDASPLLRVRDGGGYEWSKRELDAVAKKLSEPAATEEAK